ncbi:hypothetical protein OC846_002981 [Tilletia horrida]|uniref:tripeptidyl-peptidase II n=1 Tax=Tilletia horrida TaxID=155126 RepID=A0AAN6JUD3_9BASI|nr:hypothetical protein OC845_003661 [Tilletia horrida]KAK0552230.1 hypothetical protein OC846_002981 [Tilletia horrida]KAK0560724.1 hypothetical protein OC861_006151 [Tilletia horrida]
MRLLNIVTFAIALGSSSSFALINPFHAPEIISSLWQAIGLPDLSAPLTTTLQLHEPDLAGLSARMEAIAAEGSGNWLSDEELRAYISPTADSVNTVKAYLTAKGVSPSTIQLSKFGDQITFTSSLAKQQNLFSTQFQNYRVNTDGASVVVPRAKNYTIPAPLSSLVKSAFPISSFGMPKQYLPVIQADGVTVSPQELFKRASYSNCNNAQVTPACLRDAYETSSYTPSGNRGRAITIMSFIGQNFAQTDLTKFLKMYRPDAASTQVKVTNTAGGFNFPFFGSGSEVMLDIETSVSQTYPLVNDIVNYGTAFTKGDLFNLAAQYFLNLSPSQRPSVVSISYGSNEGGYAASEAQTMCASMQKLTAGGTTVVVASGDSGVSGNGGSCPASNSAFVPTYPSGCPYVVSVGATQSFPEQMVSKAGSGFTSGAGFSNIFPRPSYQDSAVQSYLSQIGGANAGLFNSGGRSFPDVAAAGSSYVIAYSGKYGLVGGTSAACPLVASLFTLVNDARSKVGKGPVGWANPVLYAHPNAFQDVTSGSSIGCGVGGAAGFSATSGFDTPSGLGAPRLSSLRSMFGV